MSAEAIQAISQVADAQPSRVTARQAIMCSDVVLKWRRDCSYLDEHGVPLALSLQHQSPTFVELVAAAAPGADPKSVLSSMEELGTVRINDRREVELICDSVVACSGRDRKSIAGELVLEHICGFLGSVEFNVFDKPSRAKGRFERACYATVPRELVPVLQQLVSSRGQTFVDAIDEWLARRAVKSGNTPDTMLVGAGAYIFIRENLA